MDKRTRYRELIKTCLEDREAYVRRARHNGIDIERVFDDANDNYLLIYVGWDKNQRVQQTALHVRLKQDQIWIESDETEEGIATELVRAAVPCQDIVLAFHPPALRHLSDFTSA
jgi:hypothetical protein